jgi:YHS domain-containing protein
MSVKVFVAVLLMFLGVLPVAFSAAPVEQKTEVVISPEADKVVPSAVNVGNTICPVSGESISEATKATYEYEGKIYNFCCSACIDEFKKDPQSYSKKAEDEVAPQSYPPADSMTAPTKPVHKH